MFVLDIMGSTRHASALVDIGIFEDDTSAWGLAELYEDEAQNVINPRDTREYPTRTLEVHRLRLKNGVGKHLLRNWPTSY